MRPFTLFEIRDKGKNGIIVVLAALHQILDPAEEFFSSNTRKFKVEVGLILIFQVNLPLNVITVALWNHIRIHEKRKSPCCAGRKVAIEISVLYGQQLAPILAAGEGDLCTLEILVFLRNTALAGIDVFIDKCLELLIDAFLIIGHQPLRLIYHTIPLKNTIDIDLDGADIRDEQD